MASGGNLKVNKTNIIIRFSIVLVFVAILANNAKAQSVLQQQFSISFENQNLVSCIKAISNKTQINFTYDPAILPNIQISKVYNNQTVNSVLYSLLNANNIAYDELSGQIILYKAPDHLKSKSIKMNLKESNAGSDLILRQLQKPDDIKESFMEIEEEQVRVDTVYIQDTDTLYITDTIIKIQTDSIIVRDTILINDSLSFFDLMFADSGKSKFTPWYSASVIASLQPKLFGDYKLQTQSWQSDDNSIDVNIKNGYSIHALFHVNANNLNARLGLGYSSILQEFSSTQISHGEYVTNDTIEQYYTGITGADTNWHYVIKERHVETEELRTKTSYANQNYIQIPISLGYSLRYKKFLFELNAGLTTSFSISPRRNDIYLYNSNDIIIDTVAFEARNFNYSVHASLAINYLINKNLSFVVQPYYCKNLQSIYAEKSPYRAELWYPSFYVGFRYFFNRKTEE